MILPCGEGRPPQASSRDIAYLASLLVRGQGSLPPEIDAILNPARGPGKAPRLLRANGVALDIDGHRAFADGAEVILGPKEYARSAMSSPLKRTGQETAETVR